MKKILMMAVMAMMAITASAQLWVEGTAGLGLQKVEDSDASFSLGLSPRLGYDLNDAFAVGIGLGEEFSSQGDFSYNLFSIEPFVRCTFAEVGSAKIFVDGILGFGFENMKNVDEVGNVFGINVAPGICCPIKDDISFVCTLGGIGWQRESFDGYSSSAFSLNIFRSVNFGLKFEF